MNNFQNENATMQTKEEFDRSVCMSFFDDHRKLVRRIERMQGIEMAYRVQNLIIDYGLDGVMPTDEELLQFVPEPVLNQIDNNQKRRSKGFQGENLDVSRSIIFLHRDHPELSQNAIAKQLSVSKGKVNKTLQKYRNGEYEGVIDLDNINIITDTNTSTPTNTGLTSDQRDRMTTCQAELADAQTDASLQEEKKKKVIECYENGMSFKKENPEIQKATGLSGKQIYDIVSTYEKEKEEKIKQEKERNKGKLIPLRNGDSSGIYTGDFSIDKEDLSDYYEKFTNPLGYYKFSQEFIDAWFLKDYGYVHKTA